MGLESRHQCFIYDGPPSHQLSVMAAVVQEKLEQGYRCVYLNSPPMVAGLRSYLSIIGIDVGKEVAQSNLILSDEPCCAKDGTFDPAKMLEQLEGALDQALNDGYKGLFATGDMTWEFGSEKNFEKLMEYEYRLENFFGRRPEMCGICQYHRDTLPGAVPAKGLLAHQTIFINQALRRKNPHYVPSAALDKESLDHVPSYSELTALCIQG